MINCTRASCITRISYPAAEKDYRTILRFLKERRYPKAVLAGLKENPDLLCVNGKPVRLCDPVSAGDRIDVQIVENDTISDQIVPQEGELDIVYEDDQLLVVNKSHHIAIHPSLHHRQMSLANLVCAHALQRNECYPFRCINRLDRDTTGLVIIAKNRLAAAILSQDIAARRIRREYIAICQGRFDQKQGTVDVPIGRMEGSVILRKADPEHGKRAVTHYKVLAENDTHSLVSLVLETGRCHQIRIHMAYIGHPLPADYLYHRDYAYYASIPLHAGRIECFHPVTGEKMVFSAEKPFQLL